MCEVIKNKRKGRVIKYLSRSCQQNLKLINQLQQAITAIYYYQNSYGNAPRSENNMHSQIHCLIDQLFRTMNKYHLYSSSYIY